MMPQALRRQGGSNRRKIHTKGTSATAREHGEIEADAAADLQYGLVLPIRETRKAPDEGLQPIPHQFGPFEKVTAPGLGVAAEP